MTARLAEDATSPSRQASFASFGAVSTASIMDYSARLNVVKSGESQDGQKRRRGKMTNKVARGRRSTGGEVLTPHPTFTESLLMEILIQVIDRNSSSSYIKKVLERAGFTSEEMEERT